MIATGENTWAMRVFEVAHNFVFVCFANGKMSIYDVETHNLVRPPIAAHTEEIKHITHGRNDTLITSCLDNQVCLFGPITSVLDAISHTHLCLVLASL